MLFHANANDIEKEIKELIPEGEIIRNGTNPLPHEEASLNSRNGCDEIGGPLRKEEIVVIVRRVTMGMGSRNPIERVNIN